MPDILYEKLSGQLEKMIRNGKFGNKLPGVHRLAKILGANHITVRKAIELLIDNGCLEVIPSRGTFIREKEIPVRKFHVIGCIGVFCGFQYREMVNTRGTQFDAELKQAQDGDPWKPVSAWNGKWEGTTEKTADGFALTFRIPFAALGYSSGQPEKLLVNFARERKANKENSMWNAVPANFNEPDSFAELDLKNKVITRCRKQEKGSYLPVRKRTAGLELLSKNEKGGYWTGSWSLGSYLQYYPATFKKSIITRHLRHTVANIWKTWQKT
ncbi:MAG: GntR family transcriptional regulator, partial [Lentisphaeria bacterium]|nr:GntR family transcriptional regulator [Lentisphaeria bacterium]